MGGGVKTFCKLEVEWHAQFDHFSEGGRHFFKLQGEGGGEAKFKSEVPEHVFMLLIAWSLIIL